MSKHMTIINLACTITKLRKWGEAWKHSAESAQAATARMNQAHEAKMVEHRAAFGARTEADAKIIAGLRSENVAARMAALERDSLISDRDGLLTQVQDMRAEIKQRAKEQDQDHKTIVSLISERDGLRVQVQDMREEIIRVNEAHGRTKVVHDGLLDELAVQRDAFTANVERIRCEGRDALRAEVAALQERLRASIARGDFAQMEVAALKSQTPQHPVKVGEWVKRLTPSPMTPAGGVAKVTDVFEVIGLAVKIERSDGIKGTWWAKCCEPCDPPQTAPVPKRAHPVAVGGHLRRLTGFNTTPAGEVARVTLVDDDDPSQLEYEVVRPNGQKGRWSAKGCEPCDPPEATHDTEAGKAAAESAVRTDPVAEEIKVGDIIEVVSATHKIYTEPEDIGRRGIVTVIEGTRLSVGEVSGYKLPISGIVGKCDVRKVTT